MKRRLTVLTAACLTLTLQPAADAAAAADCTLVKATGTTMLNPANGAFEGNLTFLVGGVPQTVHSSAVVVASEQHGAVTFLTTSHTFTLADGRVLRTIDKARLIPMPEPGVFRLVSNVEIVSGGSGFLAGPGGTIDFRGVPTAQWASSGQICAA